MNIETNIIPNNQLVKYNLENNILNMIEVSNLYPNNLIKHNIKSDERQLISYLRSEAYSICRTQISYEYIKTSFNKFKRGFVYYKDKWPVAFCIWKVKNHFKMSGSFKKLHIYLICGKQLDYKLVPKIMDDVVHLCRKSDIQYITLEPANETLKEYYIKCGFEERSEIDNSKFLVLNVNNARIIPRRNSSYKLKTLKRQRVIH